MVELGSIGEYTYLDVRQSLFVKNVAAKRLTRKVTKESLVCLFSLKRNVIIRLYKIGLWTIRTNVVIAKLYTAKMCSRGFTNPKTGYSEDGHGEFETT